MKKDTMTARKMRIILLLLLVLIFAGAAAGFLYVRRSLNEYANTISKLNADAASGDKNLQTLRQVEAKLEAEKATAEAAKSILADSTNYTEIIVNQLSAIAKASGVSITSIDFANSTVPSADAAPVTTPVAGGAAPTVAAGSAGIKSEAVTVSITSPLPYSSFMNFLKRVETSSLQMQVDSISLTTDPSGIVSTPALSIKVFVK